MFINRIGGSKQVIRALPSIGKTYVVRNYEGFCDTDGLLLLLCGDKGKSGFDKLTSNEGLASKARPIIRELLKTCDVLTNFDTAFLGVNVNVVVFMEPDDYIKHIIKSGRTELIKDFGEATLRSWAREAANFATLNSSIQSVRLKPSMYLSDVL